MKKISDYFEDNRIKSVIGPSLIFLAAFILMVIWFRKGLPIGAGETGMPFYNTPKLFSLAKYTWLEIGLGGSVPYTTVGTFLYAIASTFSRMGIPDFLIQAATYFISLCVGGLSIYLITLKEVTDNRSLPATIAGLFYMFNPFVMNAVWHRFINAAPFFLALLPLTLLLFIRGLKLRQLRYVLYLNLVLLFFSFSFSHVPYLGVIVIVLGSYLVFFVLVNIGDRRKLQFAMSFLALSAVLWVLLNVWWLLQFFTTLEFVATTSYAGQSSAPEFLCSSPLIHTLRLIHYFYTYLATNYKAIFSSSLFEVIALLIPLFTFASLLVEKKRSKNLLYFACLAIIGIFVAKGRASPLGGIFVYAFTHFRPLLVFRDTFTKLGFIVLLAYAPLFGIGVSYLYEQVKKYAVVLASLALGGLLFLVMGVYVWPIWTGMVFTGTERPANNPEIASYVEVPSYYPKANSWIKKRAGDTRIITFPLVGEGATYKWRVGYTGGNLGGVLFDNTVVSVLAPHNEIMTGKLEKALLADKTTFFKLAGLVNAKYIVVHRDMDYQIRQLTAPSQIIDALKPMRPVRTFGKLDIYEIDDEFFLPHVYAATEPKLLVQDVDDFLGAIRETDTSSLRRTVFFLLQPGEAITTLEARKFSGSTVKPKIDFEMLSPVAYRVKVKDAKEPFYLVLSESYHPQWRAYRGDISWFQALWEKPISEERHWRANGYANSWYIDEKGDFEVTLFFWPQSLVYLGYVIALITFMGCVGALGYKRIRGFKDSRVQGI